MLQSNSTVIAGWRAVLLAPLAIPIALLASVWPGRKTIDRTAAEVAGMLRDFLDGAGGEWDWDNFECVPLTDPALESIRRRAVVAGPPDADEATLRQLLAEVEVMIPRVTGVP